MTLPCRFVLDNGQPCGNRAQRFSHFCRHHDAPALHRRGPLTRPFNPVNDKAERAALSLQWRRFHAWIAQAPPEDLSHAIEHLLVALGDRRISHRSAGRLLQAIEDRRRRLAFETLSQSILETADSIQARYTKVAGAPSQELLNETLALRRSVQEWTTPSN